jgi:hypothetical protein
VSDTLRLKDTDGRIHYTARDSQAAQKLLADGATDLDAPADQPADTTAEVTDEAQPPAQGDHQDAGTADGGSSKRQRTTRTNDRGDRGTSEA